MLIETLQLSPFPSLVTNCYIYSADGVYGVVIDAAADARTIAGHLDALELEPVGIVCTHGHFDHTNATAALKILLGAPLYVGARDADCLGPGGETVHRLDGAYLGPEAIALFQQYYLPSPPADVFLREGDVIPHVNLKVLETPGHSPGGITLVGDHVAFTGDALFAGSIGRSDLHGGDEATLVAGIKNKILTLPPQTQIFPGHGPATTVGEERDHNPFLI